MPVKILKVILAIIIILLTPLWGILGALIIIGEKLLDPGKESREAALMREAYDKFDI